MISEFDTLASQQCIHGSDTFFFQILDVASQGL